MAVSLLVLAGWGKKNVELLNDKKLIDLSAALGNCILGAEDLLPEEDKANNQATPAASPRPTATPKATVTPKATATPRPTPVPTRKPRPTQSPQPEIFYISIRDQEITYHYEPCSDLDTLRTQITRDHGELVSFRLIDNYAEAHVYRKVMGLLEELKNEIGLRYMKD